MALIPGTKVAWSHSLARPNDSGPLDRAYVEHMSEIARINGESTVRFGVVTKIANESGTEIEVELEPTEDEDAHGHGGPYVRVLTADELVEVV